MKTPRTLIGVQEEYIDTVNAGIQRWSHRRDGGHTSRILRGARQVAEKRLHRLGVPEPLIAQVIKDASDMALLERVSTVDA